MIPLPAVAYLWYLLENYNSAVHNEAGLFVQLLAIPFLLLEIVLWWRTRREHWLHSVIVVIAVAVLLFVIHTGERIPFCVECDRVSAEDLGFLTH